MRFVPQVQLLLQVQGFSMLPMQPGFLPGNAISPDYVCNGYDMKKAITCYIFWGLVAGIPLCFRKELFQRIFPKDSGRFYPPHAGRRPGSFNARVILNGPSSCISPMNISRNCGYSITKKKRETECRLKQFHPLSGFYM
jgi:hypothetical protein